MSRTSRTIPALDRPSPPARTGWIRHAHPEHDPLPDVAVGRHPDFGIVAANLKQLAATA